MNSTVFTIKIGCLICGGAVKGNKEANYYCRQCNVLFSQKDVDPKKVGIRPLSVVGSKLSDKYHKQDCICVRNIDKENLAGFNSPVQAEKAGYIPCKMCQG